MSSCKLTPASSLGALALPAAHSDGAAPGVTIAERTGVSLCSVLSRKGAEGELADRVREVFGIELPHLRRARLNASKPRKTWWVR